MHYSIMNMLQCVILACKLKNVMLSKVTYSFLILHYHHVIYSLIYIILKELDIITITKTKKKIVLLIKYMYSFGKR